MQSKLERYTPLLVTAMICFTVYLCVREICKATLAKSAIEKGVITGVKKP